jgi:uncharacterized protein YjiS (DUF1127 family)
MSFSTINRSTPATSLTFSAWDILSRLLQKPVRYYRARQNLVALSALSDHELRDIGLTRTDVEAASAYPTDPDPTEILANIAQDRRRRRSR